MALEVKLSFLPLIRCSIIFCVLSFPGSFDIEVYLSTALDLSLIRSTLDSDCVSLF